MINVIQAHKSNEIIIRGEKGGLVSYDRLTPKDMPEFLTTYFLNFKDSVKWWIMDLRLYAESIITLLYYMGWQDVTFENPTVKKMPSKSFKYAIELRGNAYYIYIRYRQKTIYIYNSDNLLSNLSDREIIADFGDKNEHDELKQLADAMYNGIKMLSGFQTKRTPFTLSMLAMREWKKIEDLYFCPNLVDCKKRRSPDDKGTLARYIRKSYHGGWNYLNPDVSRETLKTGGAVYDVNSLYPYIMANKPIPWGEPEYFTGETIPHKDDDAYYYYVRVRITFDLKDGKHFPYIQKRGDFKYRFMDYLKTSDVITYGKNGVEHRTKSLIGFDGKPHKVEPELVLTKTDYELIHRHYDIHSEVILDGVVYRTAKSIFREFIGHYYAMKVEAGRSGDASRKRIAKMIMNGLSGTLAKRDSRVNLIYKERNGELDIESVTNPSQSESYIHIASAILSYAREYTYESACKNYDNFIYSDTDSLHLYDAGYKPFGIRIDNEKLGAWKIEKTFNDACYIKRKMYVHETPDIWDTYKITMSGVSYGYKKLIEDTLNGYVEEDIIERANKGEYLDASIIFRQVMQTVVDRFTFEEREKEDFTADFYRHYMQMKKDMDKYDACSILQYTEYPTGITLCDNFMLRYVTLWERVQNVDKSRRLAV